MTFHLIAHEQFLNLAFLILCLTGRRQGILIFELFHLLLHHLLDFIHAHSLARGVFIYVFKLLHYLFNVCICITGLKGFNEVFHLLSIRLIFEKDVSVSLLYSHDSSVIQGDIEKVAYFRRYANLELLCSESLATVGLFSAIVDLSWCWKLVFYISLIKSWILWVF